MKVNKETNIKTWYTKTYPTDEVGQTLKDITFKEVYERMKNGEGRQFYDMMGGDCDTIIRERTFSQLASLYECSYDTIYYLWLGGDD